MSKGKQQAIEALIFGLIRNGNILPGERIPSIRTIALQQQMSVTPVAEAFKNLEDRDIISSKQGSGYYVNPNVFDLPEFYEIKLIKQNLYSEQFSQLESQYEKYASIMLNPARNIKMLFGTTATSSSYYPEEKIAYYFQCAAKSLTYNENYQDKPKDNPQLVQEILKWIIPLKCDISAERMLVVNSVLQGLILALSSITQPGDLIAVETPGFFSFHSIADYCHLNTLCIPSSPDTGLDVDYFEHLLINGTRPKALVLTVNFSNPTGALMPDETKARLVSICVDYDIAIIEDDTLGDLYFDDFRPYPLKSFNEENVIYISGFGKIFSPSTRIAFIGGGKYHSTILKSKHLIGAFVPPIIQTGFAEFLGSSENLKHLRVFRKTVFEIVSKYHGLLLECLPKGTEIRMPRGGPYLWVKLPDGFDAGVLSDKAREHGISIAPGYLFRIPAESHGCFRFNCLGMPFSKAVEEALILLGKLAETVKPLL